MIVFADMGPISFFALIAAALFVWWLCSRPDKKKGQPPDVVSREEQQRKADEESRKRREAARLRDIRLKQAMEELENGTYDRVIWAKALIMADGSQSKARALYLQLRIGEL